MAHDWSDFIQDCEAAELGSWLVETIAACIGMIRPECATAREVEDCFNKCYVAVLEFDSKGIYLKGRQDSGYVSLDGLLDLDDAESRLLLQQRFWECVEKCQGL